MTNRRSEKGNIQVTSYLGCVRAASKGWLRVEKAATGVRCERQVWLVGWK